MSSQVVVEQPQIAEAEAIINFVKIVKARYNLFFDYSSRRIAYLKELRRSQEFQERKEVNKKYRSALAEALKNSNIEALKEAKNHYDLSKSLKEKLEEKFKEQKTTLSALSKNIKALDTQIIAEITKNPIIQQI